MIMGLIDNVNVEVNGSGDLLSTLSTYTTKILKPNIIDGRNVLTQRMVSAKSTKYVIKYDYELEEDITVPANCVLEFDGGSISGTYSVLFNNTTILGNANGCLRVGCDIESTFGNDEIYVDWFVTEADRLTDCSTQINNLIETSCKKTIDIKAIKFGPYVYNIAHSIVPVDYNSGRGDANYICMIGTNIKSHRTKSTTIKVKDGTNSANIDRVFGSDSVRTHIIFKDICFDANSIADYAFKSIGISWSTIRNCSFKHAIKCCFNTTQSYSFNIVECLFEGVYGVNPGYYGLFLGGSGVCNAVNIVRCVFESLNVGIFIVNGFNFNIDGCTIEGIINLGIGVSYGKAINIKGCYFEDVAEGRVGSTLEFMLNKTGIPLCLVEDTNYYILADSTPVEEKRCKDTRIYADILIGIEPVIMTNNIYKNKIISIADYAKPIQNETRDVFARNITIENCNCQRMLLHPRCQEPYSYHGNPAFVAALKVVGLSIKNNTIFANDPQHLTSNRYIATFSPIVVEKYCACRDVELKNNTNSANNPNNIYPCYINPRTGDEFNYILGVSTEQLLSPKTDYPYVVLKSNDSIPSPTFWHKGKAMVQSSRLTSNYDITHINAGDTITIGFWYRNGGYKGDLNITIKDESDNDVIQCPLNIATYDIHFYTLTYRPSEAFNLKTVIVDCTNVAASRLSIPEIKIQ